MGDAHGRCRCSEQMDWNGLQKQCNAQRTVDEDRRSTTENRYRTEEVCGRESNRTNKENESNRELRKKSVTDDENAIRDEMLLSSSLREVK